MSTLDLGALHVFYMTGLLGGVGAAARALRVTQPAVSQRLAALERSVGRKLYGRVGRCSQLTEDGRSLYAACRDAFSVLQSVEDAFKGREAEPLSGLVRIASLSEAAKAHLLPHLLDFHRRNPAVVFDLDYRLPYEMLRPLVQGKVDFVVTNEPYRRPQVEMVPRWEEEVVCIGLGPARRLGWKELAALTWIAYGTEDPLWYELEKASRRKGVRLPKPSLNAADVDTVMRMAAAGAGCALVPDHALSLHAHPGLVTHRLPIHLSKTIHIGRLTTLPMGRAAKAFWDELVAVSGRRLRNERGA